MNIHGGDHSGAAVFFILNQIWSDNSLMEIVSEKRFASASIAGRL